MSKKVLLISVVSFAAMIAMSANSLYAKAQPAPAKVAAPAYIAAPVAQPRTVAGPGYRQRVGLGFNGIPFDGSHREATRMRRAYRSGYGY